jgi:hypothetical protein
MRLWLLLLIILPLKSFADSSVNCELSEGIYSNSVPNLQNLTLGTHADIFSITNAKNLSFEWDGIPMHFIRDEIKITRYTQMNFYQSLGDHILRRLIVMIDRTPKKVLETGEFNGNMIMSGILSDELDWLINRSVPKFTYNFSCRLNLSGRSNQRTFYF